MSERSQKAYEWNTLPKYVFQDAQREYRNFEHDIAYAPADIKPKEFYNSIRDQSTIPFELSLQEIVIPLVLGNQAFQQRIRELKADPLFLSEANQLDEETTTAILSLWEDIRDEQVYKNLIESIQEERTQFRTQFERQVAIQTQLDELKSIEYTAFQKERIIHVYDTDKPYPQGLLGLFNNIQLSEDIPLVISHSFYKILYGLELSMDIPDEKTIYIWIRNIRVEVTEQKDDTLRILVPSEEALILQKVIKLVAPLRIKENTKETMYSGSFILLQQTLNAIVWADFVMNNPIVSKDFVIDEHIRATKLRTGTYTFYIHPADEEKADSEKVKTSFILSNSERGLRVKVLNIKAGNNDIPTLQQKLSKYFALYNTEGQQIIDIYNTFLTEPLPPFEGLMKRQRAAPKNPRKQIEGLFPPNYSRRCAYIPDVVTEEQARQLEEEGYHIMLFPRTSTEGTQHYFSCAQKEEHIYPGVKTNNLQNRDKYPYLPCCYKDDQRTKMGTAYSKYYNDNVDQGDLRQRHLRTDKFVQVLQTGELPKQLRNIIKTLDPQGVPLRKGMTASPQSLLECVLDALGQFKQMGIPQRTALVKRELAKLLKLDWSWIRQELWDTTTADEKKKIESGAYFDPRKFARLLERVYKVRIVVVSRDDFIHPRYGNGFLDFKPTRFPIVVIYENLGGEADIVDYPHCELVQGITLLEKLYNLYTSSLKAVNIPMVVQTETLIFTQCLTKYGHCYALEITKGFLFVPEHLLPPFQAPVRKYDLWINTQQGEPKVWNGVNGKQVPILRGVRESVSYLDNFDKVRQQSYLLLENAKHISATENIAFENILKVKRATVLRFPNTFVNQRELFVPDEDTRQRALQQLYIQSTRKLDWKDEYRQLSHIPVIFQTPSDFTQQEGVYIGDVNYPLQWGTSQYSTEPKTQGFFLKGIQGQYYFAEPVVEEPKDIGALYVVNTKEYLINTKPQGDIYALYIDNNNTKLWFKLFT